MNFCIWPSALPRSPTASSVAWAQAYPTRPITLVVPFAAGGSFDVIARVITPRLSEILGQQVIVENVGAAAGIVGVNRMAHAIPDGYSVLLGTVGTHAYNPALYKKLPYNPASDFAPVGLVAEQPLVLIARKDFPPKTLPEFIAYAKANADKLQYGSAGVGSTTHLACAFLNAAAGINVTHVPYRGAGPAIADMIGGQIQYMCSNTPGALPQIQGGTVKGIALLARDRSPLMPELATAHEQGLTDFEAIAWSGSISAERHTGGDRVEAQSRGWAKRWIARPSRIACTSSVQRWPAPTAALPNICRHLSSGRSRNGARPSRRPAYLLD